MLVHTINHLLRLSSFIQNSNRFLSEYITSNGASILWLLKSRISIAPDARVFTFSFRISASRHHNCLQLFHLLFLRESRLLTASLPLLPPLSTNHGPPCGVFVRKSWTNRGCLFSLCQWQVFIDFYYWQSCDSCWPHTSWITLCK